MAVWLDDISRDRLASGSLAELVRTRHVTGVTSNPTIFAQAVSNGTAYDRQLAELAARGAAAEEAARQIVLGQPLAHVHRQQQRLITLRIKEVLRHTQDPKYRPYLTEGTPFMRQAETSIAALL